MRAWKARIVRRERLRNTRDLATRRHFNSRLRQLRAGGGRPVVMGEDAALEQLAKIPYGHTCATRIRTETYGELVDMKGLVSNLPKEAVLDKDSVFVRFKGHRPI